MAPLHLSGLLRPGEEEWLGVFERLVERFPNFGTDRVLTILRENNGHAGQAAAQLRDLSGTAMRAVDPDDAEHVRTLLSSPVMFSHACKEQFRKHDVNGDGVLEWSEILTLTNSLYENFGLEPPREGGLRAFFEANDTNHDGVLSEKEFKQFFECFLRYAFFDVVNQQDLQQQPKVVEDDEEPAPPARPAASPQRDRGAGQRQQVRSSPTASERPLRSKPDGSPTAAEATVVIDLEETPVESKSKSRRRPEGTSPTASSQVIGGPGAVLRCMAGNGVTYRRSPEWGDRGDAMVQKGEEVQVLEQWIRTSKGWLPVADKNGQATFEVAQEPQLSRGTSDVERKSRSHKSGSSTGATRRSKTSSSLEEAEGGSRRLLRSERSESAVGSSLPPAGNAPPAAQRPGSRGGAEPEAPQQAGAPAAPQRSEGPPRTLQPEEEEWRPRWIRLQERFPTASPEDAAQALRDHNGHAGQAASALRALTG